MAQKQTTSPWVWAFLLLVLASFVAFIMFLDQRIANSRSDSSPAGDTSEEQKPRIDFYTVLPKRQVEIPISEEDREGLENPSINKEAGISAILQVGSFQSAADADSLKARLAFLGLEARIRSARVDNETWHRVQLGPFASNSKLSRAKNLLLEHDIEYIQREQPQ